MGGCMAAMQRAQRLFFLPAGFVCVVFLPLGASPLLKGTADTSKNFQERKPIRREGVWYRVPCAVVQFLNLAGALWSRVGGLCLVSAERRDVAQARQVSVQSQHPILLWMGITLACSSFLFRVHRPALPLHRPVRFVQVPDEAHQ
jgi:hypothetical protein